MLIIWGIFFLFIVPPLGLIMIAIGIWIEIWSIWDRRFDEPTKNNKGK